MQPRSVLIYPWPALLQVSRTVAEASVPGCGRPNAKRPKTANLLTLEVAKERARASSSSCLLQLALVLFKGWVGLLKPRGRVCRRTRAAACAPDLRTQTRAAASQSRAPTARRRSGEQRYAAGRRESEAKLSRGNVADVCGRRGAAGAGAGAGARREHAVAHRARAYDR